MQMSPVIAIHLSTALTALVIGPVALWARMGREQHPRLHRAFGYAWVTCMVIAAVSAIFIKDWGLPNIGGFTLIHLFVPFTFGTLWVAFRKLALREFVAHKHAMQRLYLGACIGAGSFTLLPERYLGNLIWHEWLAWV